MTLFAIFAVMSGIAVLIALAPLARARGSRAESRLVHDETVYRAQLEAVERDEAAGISSHAEAEAARAEIARRVIAARKLASPEGRSRSAPGWAAVALAVAVPAIALPIYLVLGQPGLEGEPAAERRAAAAAANAEVHELVARVEAHLAANPDDAQGWKVLAPVYMRMGRHDAAANAYRNAMRLEGPSAPLQADLGEALAAAAGGVITGEAREVLQAALESDPNAIKPQFLLAIASEQDGDWGTAADRWEALLDSAPEGAPWRGEVEARLAQAQGQGGRGPGVEDVAAAQDMSAEERSAMIEGMVSGLAARLAEDGDDLDGWLQLARAYVVLGRMDEARGALESARKNFPADTDRIAEASRRLGIGS